VAISHETMPDARILTAVEAALQRLIQDRGLAPRLDEAVRYACLDGGKRVRPLLAIRCGMATGEGELERLLPAAVAFECIHAFSLVHDDLPALDNDDLRRGRPTTHKAFGEALAILAGDALQSVAIECALSSPRQAQRVAAEVARACTDMISGQVLDTLGGFPADCTDPMEQLRLIHRNKTGALIRGACRCGAIAAGAPETMVERVSQFGDRMGLMFQVVDDILDETQTTQTLGKSAGKDKAQGKRTYPALMGLEASRGVVRQLHEQAVALLEPLGDPAEPLRTMVEQLATRTR
jgi:geranylgeranyl diphosphate synthase type II